MSLVKTIHSFSGAAKSRSFRTSVRQRQLVIHFSGQCTELSLGGALPLFTRGSFQALNISADVMERKKMTRSLVLWHKLHFRKTRDGGVLYYALADL